MNSARQPRWSVGFTLIELLVTMTLIGILAALLLPALAKAKSRARQAACAGNLRQIGIAFHGFAHDHGGRFPQQVSTNAGGALEWSRWPEPLWGVLVQSPAPFASLSNELGNPRVLGCPAVGFGPSNVTGLRASGPGAVGYLATISASLGDSLGTLALDRNLDSARTRRDARGALEVRVNLAWTPERHGGRGNTLWGDGHVELRRDLQLASPTTAGGSSGTGPIHEPAPNAGGRGSGGREKSGPAGRSDGVGGGRAEPPGADGIGAARHFSVGAPAVRAVREGGARPIPEGLSPSHPVWNGSEFADEREARERRDRWIQRSLLWLIVACMCLGFVAVLAHAWQRYRAMS